VTALLVDGTSLLPIGVTDTTDNFERGEAVHCMNLKGEEIALGLINYSATETRKILGSTSSVTNEALVNSFTCLICSR